MGKEHCPAVRGPSASTLVSFADQLCSGTVEESKTKLARRISEFLRQADPAERQDLEDGRRKLLETMKAAQAQQSSRYPQEVPASAQTRRRKVLAEVKAGCRTFSEVAYGYSQIMDVLIGQAPEYVALAWGAIKIILVVQINYEEMKQKVKTHMDLIRSRFEMIDHLTAYLPRANLVASVAKAYELFSRFLAKAVRYYSLNRFSKYDDHSNCGLSLIGFLQRPPGKHFPSHGKRTCKALSMRLIKLL